MRVFLGVVVLSLWAGVAQAGDWVFGLGATDFSFDEAENDFLVEVEYHYDPFRQFLGADLSFALAATAHGNGDLFLGAGLSAYRLFSNGWFVENSFMPGLYLNADDATDLGSELEFRSLLGVGRQFNESTAISLAFSHKSNASLGRINPGVNSYSLRLRKTF